jgi:hypothetical protein
MKVNKLKSLLIAICCSATVLCVDTQGAEAIDEQTTSSSKNKTSHPIYIKEMKSRYDDNPIPFIKDTSIELMKKCYDNFDKSNRVYWVDNNSKILVITGSEMSYQLESRRIEIKEGQIIKVKYKIDVDFGTVGIGFLNSTRSLWYGGSLQGLSEGQSKSILERIVPEGETMVSLVFYTLKPKCVFTIKNLELLIEEKK